MDFWRYSRQVALESIGFSGQEKLKSANVSVVGLGGLGSQVAMSLAAMGVGKLILVDFDVVSEPDLHRQLIFTEEHIGMSKVEAAALELKKRNSSVKVEPLCVFVDEKSAEKAVKDADLVVDCLDTLSSKYALNRACIEHKKALVFGSALEEYGMVSVFKPWVSACIECVYPNLSDEGLPTCATAGVLPQLVQLVGSIMAAQAVKQILGQNTLLDTLLFIDLKDASFEKVSLLRNPNCPAHLGLPLSYKNEVTEMCTRNGRRLLMLKLENPPKIEEALTKLSQNSVNAKLVGTQVLSFVDEQGSRFSYTSAGVLLAEISEVYSTIDEAKLVVERVSRMLN